MKTMEVRFRLLDGTVEDVRVDPGEKVGAVRRTVGRVFGREGESPLLVLRSQILSDEVEIGMAGVNRGDFVLAHFRDRKKEKGGREEKENLPVPEAVRELTDMGFSEDEARRALASCNGDVQRAVFVLVNAQPPTPSNPPPAPPSQSPKSEVVMVLEKAGASEDLARRIAEMVGDDVENGLAAYAAFKS